MLLAARQHELPHPGRAHPGDGPRRKARFSLCQMNQLLGKPLLIEDPADQGAVAARAPESAQESLFAAYGREVVDVADDLVIELQRQLRGSGLEFLGDLIPQLWVDTECRLGYLFDRRIIENRAAVRLRRPQAGEVVPMDVLHQRAEFPFQILPSGRLG